MTEEYAIATDFTPEQEEIRRVVRAFASKEIGPAAATNDDRPVIDPKFNDSVDDLYAEAEDDRHSQAMADKFAISF